MRIIAVFDFDGTITQKDTLLEFIKFSKGKWSFLKGFLYYSPLLVAYKLRLYPNWKVKQKIFSYFFKDMKYEVFCQLGLKFKEKINNIVKEAQIEKLTKHLEHGDTVYVISASIEEWILPWCHDFGKINVLGTKIEVIDGIITGKLQTKNCYGQEKVNRLLEKEPNRDSYYLYAYGDSKGDKEILAFADKGFLCK